MIDPFGVVLAIIRDDATVAGIAGSRVSAKVTEPSSVRLSDLGTTKRPFGPGSGRIGLLAWTGVATCYGPDVATGPITAFQLAAAVSDALDQHTTYRDGTRLMFRAYAPDIDGKGEDPKTKWPMYQVPITAYFQAEATA